MRPDHSVIKVGFQRKYSPYTTENSSDATNAGKMILYAIRMSEFIIVRLVFHASGMPAVTITTKAIERANWLGNSNR